MSSWTISWPVRKGEEAKMINLLLYALRASMASHHGRCFRGRKEWRMFGGIPSLAMWWDKKSRAEMMAMFHFFFCKTFFVGEDGCCGWVSFFAFSIPQVGMACMDNLNYDQYIDHLSQVNIRISTKRNISAFHVTILRGSWRRTTWWCGAPGTSSTPRCPTTHTHVHSYSYFNIILGNNNLLSKPPSPALAPRPGRRHGRAKKPKVSSSLISKTPNGGPEEITFDNVQVFEWHPTDPAVLVAGLANGQLVDITFHIHR